MLPDHEGEREEEEELTDLVARHEVRQLLRLDPELALHCRQRGRQVRVTHACFVFVWCISKYGECVSCQITDFARTSCMTCQSCDSCRK